MRGGTVNAMLAMCERYKYVNRLMGSMAADSEGRCKVEDVQVRLRFVFVHCIALCIAHCNAHSKRQCNLH